MKLTEQIRALIIEDLPTDAELNEREVRLVLPNCEFFRVETREDFLAALGSFKPDIILSDYKLPSFDGMAALLLAKERVPEIPFIIITGSMNEDTAVECMKAGAWDYVIKEHIKRLGPAIQACLEKKNLRQEQRHANEKNLKSEKKYHDLFDATLDGIFRVDTEGVFTLMNPAGARIFGHVNPDEMVGRKALDYWRDPAERDAYRAELQIRKSLSSYPMGAKRKNGEPIDLESSSRIIEDEDGHVLGIEGILRDVTERKRAEEALKKSEEFVENILSSVDEAFVVVDRDYLILTANRAYCEQAGKPLAEIKGKHCYEISHHVTRPCHELEKDCACKRTFETGESAVAVHTHTDDKGRRSHVEIKTYAMRDESGGIHSIIEVINDVTEKVALENQLRHAQKMEGIGTLAGGIAHDFNNILSAIMGYGYVALMDMQQNDPHRINIEHMLESADRAASLTQNLLAFSRKQIIDRKPIELNKVLMRVEKFVARVIGEDVDIRMAFDKHELTVFADAGQLEQVFMNLATNARDAMPKGGSFLIETTITTLDNGFVSAHGYGKPGAYAMVAATDTGVGMNEETRKKIFEPFFTTKEVGKGTGLGLAMVYGIIKQHDGFINVYSEPGKGTTFRIYLPLIKTTTVDEKREIETGYPPGGTETILLAEDDANLRSLTVIVLEQMGYTVITSNDGDEAVAKFRENKDKVQLLLFDVIMPKKSGKEAYDEISKLRPGIPVLYASGYSPDMLRQKMLFDKGTEIAYKPVSPMNLCRKVRVVLDKKK